MSIKEKNLLLSILKRMPPNDIACTFRDKEFTIQTMIEQIENDNIMALNWGLSLLNMAKNELNFQ